MSQPQLVNFKRKYDSLPNHVREEIADYKTLEQNPGWLRIVKRLKEDIKVLEDRLLIQEVDIANLTPDKAFSQVVADEITRRKYHHLRNLINLPKISVEKCLQESNDAIPKQPKNIYD